MYVFFSQYRWELHGANKAHDLFCHIALIRFFSNYNLLLDKVSISKNSFIVGLKSANRFGLQ